MSFCSIYWVKFFILWISHLFFFDFIKEHNLNWGAAEAHHNVSRLLFLAEKEKDDTEENKPEKSLEGRELETNTSLHRSILWGINIQHRKINYDNSELEKVKGIPKRISKELRRFVFSNSKALSLLDRDMGEKQTCLILGVGFISQDFCSAFKNLAYFSNKSPIGAAILKVVLDKTKKE